jgi:coenzyme F420-0:L-glutamate ligase / coenzyme F420-1:gamma-L-glutamate ligase
MPLSTDPSCKIEILAIDGIPEVSAGASVAELILRGLQGSGLDLRDSDVIVIAQKIISKAEGRLVSLSNIQPSPFALALARSLGKDPRHVEVILQETKRIVRMDGGLIISETHHGFVCANAGVDASNVADGWLCLLPCDPDASARRVQQELMEATGKLVAVIISDTFGRPWREGLTNVAIGIAGFQPLLDYRGRSDTHGHALSATIIAVADELAAAAELVMGKLSARPTALIRGYHWKEEPGSASALVRARERDLFR